MNRIIMILIVCVVLSSCHNGETSMTVSNDIKTRCLDGIEYYLFREKFIYNGYGYMAVKYNSDGSLSKCEVEENNDER